MPGQGDVIQARRGSHGDYAIIVLTPCSVEETFTLTVRAFNLSERFRTPVVLLMDEIVGHTAEKAFLPGAGELEVVGRRTPEVPPDSFLPYAPDPDDIPPMAAYGTGYRFHVTGLCHDETGFPSNNPAVADALVRRLSAKIEDHSEEIVDVEWDRDATASVGIFAYGSTARSAKGALRALRDAGTPATLLRPKVLWPFPDEDVSRLAEDVEVILVPEMNLGQMSREIQRVACGRVRVQPLTRVDGEPIRPEQIVDAVRALL
jgi:2-oxoglutarate ferredoxin oxidoreductase subunit alpha